MYNKKMAAGLLGQPSADGQGRRSPHPRPPVHYPSGPRSEQYLGVWDTASWLPLTEPHGHKGLQPASPSVLQGQKQPLWGQHWFIRHQHQHPTPGDQTASQRYLQTFAQNARVTAWWSRVSLLSFLLTCLKQHPPMLRLPPARREKKISNINFRTGHGRGPIWAGVFPEEMILWKDQRIKLDGFSIISFLSLD